MALREAERTVAPIPIPKDVHTHKVATAASHAGHLGSRTCRQSLQHQVQIFRVACSWLYLGMLARERCLVLVLLLVLLLLLLLLLLAGQR
jgi:hypothetical protein